MRDLVLAAGAALTMTTTGCASAIQYAFAPGREATVETHRHPSGRLQVTARPGSAAFFLPAMGATMLGAGNLPRLLLVFRTDVDAMVIAGLIGFAAGVIDGAVTADLRNGVAPAVLEVGGVKGRAPRQIKLVSTGDGYAGDAVLSTAEWAAPLTYKLRDAQGREIPIQRVETLRNGR